MKDYMTVDMVRRVLIRTAWEARKREQVSRARLAELSLDDSMTYSIFFEGSARAWQAGYKDSRLHAARLLPRRWEQKKEVANG